MDRNSATTMTDETTNLYREIDRLKADLRQLRGDVGGVGGDAVRTARAGINEAVKLAAAQGKAAADGAEKQITSHPFLAVTAAFAVGMILGLRLMRKA